MRDRYLKEVRMEIKSKKQGELIHSKWKYRQIMNFIAPFTGSRCGLADICGNDEDDHDQPDNDSGSIEGETTSSDIVRTPQSVMKSPISPPDLKPQVGLVPLVPSMTQETQMTQLAATARLTSNTPLGKGGRKRRPAPDSLSPHASQNTHSPAKWFIKDNGTMGSRPRDEDELFLLSFVPALKRLAPQKRCETKIKIQQILYEAEFNISQDKHREQETRD